MILVKCTIFAVLPGQMPHRRPEIAFGERLLDGTVHGFDLEEVVGIKNRSKLVYTSYVNSNFPVTMLESGLIFETDKKPDAVLPINWLLISDLYKALKEKKNKSTALREVKKFNFKDVERFEETDYKEVQKEFCSIVDKYQLNLSSENSILKRGQNYTYKYYKKKSDQLFTEVIFKKQLKNIKPLAIFGFSKSVQARIRKDFNLDLPLYKSALEGVLSEREKLE